MENLVIYLLLHIPHILPLNSNIMLNFLLSKNFKLLKISEFNHLTIILIEPMFSKVCRGVCNSKCVNIITHNKIFILFKLQY